MDANTTPRPAKILGEFGSITQYEFAKLKRDARDETNEKWRAELNSQVEQYELQYRPWPEVRPKTDNDTDRILELRLRVARDRGYELAMCWPSPVRPWRVTYDDLKLEPRKLASISRFTRNG